MSLVHAVHEECVLPDPYVLRSFSCLPWTGVPRGVSTKIRYLKIGDHSAENGRDVEVPIAATHAAIFNLGETDTERR